MSTLLPLTARGKMRTSVIIIKLVTLIVTICSVYESSSRPQQSQHPDVHSDAYLNSLVQPCGSELIDELEKLCGHEKYNVFWTYVNPIEKSMMYLPRFKCCSTPCTRYFLRAVYCNDYQMAKRPLLNFSIDAFFNKSG